MTPAFEPADLSLVRLRWAPAYRIVPTRYPTVYLFDRVAEPDDFDALYALEALTNDRIRDETGQIELVAPEERLYGPGSGPIMAAFTHLNPQGTRFSAGHYGVFYASRERETAIAETQYHHARFLLSTHEPPLQLPMRLYAVRIDARLHDVRPPTPANDALHDPGSYRASQHAGEVLRAAGSNGVVFRSVRRDGGQNAGLFRPRGARDCVHAAHLLYAWDGQRFHDVYEKVA